MLNSNGSLATAIRPKTKYILHAAAMLLFYILQKNITKLGYFSKMYYVTSSQ